MLATLRRDLAAVRDRDPAARHTVEVVLTYAGLHAVWAHRVNHRLWNRGFRLVARLGSMVTRFWTGIEIHPAARLGPGLFIDHGMGIVIGETAEVGSDVTIFHGVTLGGTSRSRGKRHPSVGDRVTIGSGAKVLGAIAIGHDSRIGANAVVVKDVPANSVVVGVPGQVIARSTPRTAQSPLDLDPVVPDLVGTSLQQLLHRVDDLEAAVDGRVVAAQASPTDSGVWPGEDFSI
jgi:serine O-acetyltransferase